MPRKPVYNKYKHEGGFIGLPKRVFTSHAYRQLSPVARCILDELQHRYLPNRNGRIGFSISNACDALNVSQKPVSRGFNELIKYGFIRMMADADYSIGKTREWRLTFQPFNGREPTDEWMQWETEKTETHSSN